MSASSAHQASKLASRLDKLYEFERAPVTEDQLQGGRRFAGLFAGEHVAATEFVIGVLFVQWGAGARDLIWGLVIGNFLAVLSWAFICSPIAVRTRLTLYWYVRRIIGPGLTVIYNFVNAILYCCLAAAMIGVSASAVILALSKVGIRIQHPTLDDVYPNSVGWIVVVLIVGAVVVTLAIAGFKKLAQFAGVCSPWMFLVFIAGAIASLPKLGEFHSTADLWNLAETKIWTGQPYERSMFTISSAYQDDAQTAILSEPLRAELAKNGLNLSDQATLSVEVPGSRWTLQDGEARYIIRPNPGKGDVQEGFSVCSTQKYGFWHIMFFAWFCNLAMHVGLSDMALFRYAKHWTYGFYSAFGMYLGHFVAWICAGVMGAVVGSGLNPGEMADTAAGIAGTLAVLLAGWTTANPTIYRAGLALQIVTPNWPRWKVTIAAGAVTTLVGCFPAIFMQLLNFVAIYGLMLMPIGAIIVIEHWLFPKLGLPQYWTQTRKLAINMPALISWVTVLVLCFPIEQFTDNKVTSPMQLLGVHLFFRWLPGWFIAAIVYIVLCRVWPGVKGTPAPAEEVLIPAGRPAVKPAAAAPDAVFWFSGAAALFALAMCLVLPIRVLVGGTLDYDVHMDSYKHYFMIWTVIYFVAAVVWTGRRERLGKGPAPL